MASVRGEVVYIPGETFEIGELAIAVMTGASIGQIKPESSAGGDEEQGIVIGRAITENHILEEIP